MRKLVARACVSGLALSIAIACSEQPVRTRPAAPPREAPGSATARAAASPPSTDRTPGASTSGPGAAHADSDPEASAAFIRLDGDQLRAAITASRRRATLVNIWASFCGSCKQEIPMLVDAARGLETEGVGLVLLNADAPDPDTQARAAELLATLGGSLPSHALGGGVRAFRRTIDERWKGALPATFLFDAKGAVRYFWNGPVLAHEVTPIVQGLLAGEPIDGMTDFAAPRAD